MDTHEGGCHCGAVRFRVAVERYEALKCNCSMCRKKANLHLIVPQQQFTLLQRCGRADDLSIQHRGRAAHLLQDLRHPPVLHAALAPRLRRRQRPLPGRRRAWPLPRHAFDGANWEANVDRIRASR